MDVGIGISQEVTVGMKEKINVVVEQLRNYGYEVKNNGIKSEH